MKHSWFRRYWYWVVIAIILIASGALISVFDSCWFCQHVLKFFNDWSIALSAGAAVILALAAFLTIRNSNEREKRRRKEELAKETRDRRERWLNEIIEWALDVNKCGMGHQSIFSQAAVVDPVTQEKMFRSLTLMYDLSSNIQGEAATLIVRSEYIKSICKKAFGKNLYSSIQKVISALNEYNNSLSRSLEAIPVDLPIKASDMNNMEKLAKEVYACKQVVRKLVNELLDKATSMQIDLS